MSFINLLEIDEPSRSEAIRKAFAPYTPLLEVSENISAAILALLNLSHKRQFAPDLLNKKRAVETLKDWEHIESCAQEMQWLHSHNLKLPDTRVAHQRLLVRAEKPSGNVLSSFNSVSRLGWSHNSAAVNKAKLFGAQFIFNGETHCLATVIMDNEERWKEEFKKLGISAGQWIYLQSLFEAYFTENLLPSYVDRCSVQVTFIYQGKDVSITPVTSHSLLADIQIARRNKTGNFSTIKHWHPSSVGDLSSSLGGNISALNYPPRLLSNSCYKNKNFSEGSFLDFHHSSLRSKSFIFACNDIIESKSFLTAKERRDARRAGIKLLRQSLSEWLSPVSYWRSVGREVISERHNNTACLLISALDEDVLGILPEVNKELHSILVRYPQTQSFAYRSDLLIPFKSQLKFLLTKLKKQKGEDTVENNFHYLHLKNLHIFDAQALSCPYIVGLPSLLAVWGTVYNYQLRLRKILKRSIVFEEVAWFLRQYEPSSGAKIPAPYQPPVKPGGAPKRPGLIDMRFCDLRMDLVIRYRIEDRDDTPVGNEELPILQSAFPGRFAGGTMQPPPLHEELQWCQVYADENSLLAAISLLPDEGRWIVDSEKQVQSIESLVAWLSKHPNHLPATSGYQLLEEPCYRSGSHREHHAYAEPLVGLTETLSPASVRLNGKADFLKNAFWRLQSQNLTMLMKKA
ncbi:MULTISPECIES: hypothetical protein [Halomonadaceae]|uniref:hypothetical protein n=1 Tax=Halomonadaceae TaxID=28256 RepID=UPI0003474791|nr:MULTISPECIES: hypothetical protein [Halomonas]NVE89717.1 hypothetical protein [Halomonas titanicae]CAD5260546.1 conserved hypothetical protein [Halomonas sp. 156]CAD5288441.1 conserved hypothetical protein [Halomonas sp. 113]CAD5289884.1 conserved hypothetical protein [Halomonas sp. 59]CAD5292840.1 conserved hypothetical protein [Halomonas sp. I3]